MIFCANIWSNQLLHTSSIFWTHRPHYCLSEIYGNPPICGSVMISFTFLTTQALSVAPGPFLGLTLGSRAVRFSGRLSSSYLATSAPVSADLKKGASEVNNWGDSSTEFRGNKSHPEFLRHSEPLRDLIFLSIFLHGGEFQDCIQDWSDWYLWIMGLEDIFPGSAHCDWQVSRPLAHPRMGIRMDAVHESLWKNGLMTIPLKSGVLRVLNRDSTKYLYCQF